MKHPPAAAIHRTAIGKTIELTAMPNDPDPIPVGTRGVVESVQEFTDSVQIRVNWENGRGLALVCPPDRYKVVS